MPLEPDEIKAIIEGEADGLHPDIIRCDAVLRMSRQRACFMSVFWREREMNLKELVCGTLKSPMDELDRGLEFWRGVQTCLRAHPGDY